MTTDNPLNENQKETPTNSDEQNTRSNSSEGNSRGSDRLTDPSPVPRNRTTSGVELGTSSEGPYIITKNYPFVIEGIRHVKVTKSSREIITDRGVENVRKKSVLLIERSESNTENKQESNLSNNPSRSNNSTSQSKSVRYVSSPLQIDNKSAVIEQEEVELEKGIEDELLIVTIGNTSNEDDITDNIDSMNQTNVSHTQNDTSKSCTNTHDSFFYSTSCSCERKKNRDKRSAHCKCGVDCPCGVNCSCGPTERLPIPPGKPTKTKITVHIGGDHKKKSRKIKKVVKPKNSSYRPFGLSLGNSNLNIIMSGAVVPRPESWTPPDQSINVLFKLVLLLLLGALAFFTALGFFTILHTVDMKFMEMKRIVYNLERRNPSIPALPAQNNYLLNTF
uniref:Uncharacterized protein n=1 Tax=Cacopsylla melanoneura TaxID=428564 RepID=A0A8D9BM41_9HEMI